MFSEKELALIQDKEFLLQKIKITKKVRSLLLDTRVVLSKSLKKSSVHFPNHKDFLKGKISKGENYLGLPYQVLDYPAVFKSKNIFAFRTMFWWGNFFSVTLHLQGTSLDFYRRTLIENIHILENQEIYIAVGKDPWQYHYGKDNYEPLQLHHREYMKKCTFLKLSKKLDLNRSDELPAFATDFYRLMERCLTSE